MKKLLSGLLLITSLQVFANNQSLNGFGFISSAHSRLPAVLINYKGAPDNFKNRNAIVLSCGHCVVGAIYYNAESKETNSAFKLNFRDVHNNIPFKYPRDQPFWRKGYISLNGDKVKAHQLRIKRVLYATQYQSDISLIELELTYKELEEKFGIRSHTLSSTTTSIGTEILLINTANDFMGLDEEKSIIQKCKIVSNNGFSTIDTYPKIFEDSDHEIKREDRNTYSYRQCVSHPGFSGSALLNVENGEIVGVNWGGTVYDLESKDWDNWKRYLEAMGVSRNVFEADTGFPLSHGIDGSIVYSCLNQEFEFDLYLDTCKLFKLD